MPTNHKSSANLSVVGRALNVPATFIDWFFWRFCKINHCEVRGETLVLRKGFSTSWQVRFSEIERWSVREEMGFDVITVQLQNGETITWVDRHNDLLDGLKRIAGAKRV